MSYVSGFMMGAAIGKSIRQAFGGSAAPAVKTAAPKAQPPIALISAQAGRRRYRASFSAELAKALEEKLSKLNFIQSVKANAVSGSILLTFDEKDSVKVDALAKWLALNIFTPKVSNAIENENSSTNQESAANESHAGAITRSIRNSARSFSAWIKKMTCGWLDMSSLASLLFFLRGLRKVILTQQYPSGAQMLWWALSLMRGWRTV